MTSASTIGNAFYYYYYYGGSFDIAERVGNLTILMSGTARATATPGRIAGQLEGGIDDVVESRGPVRAVQRPVPWHPWFRNGEAVADP